MTFLLFWAGIVTIYTGVIGYLFTTSPASILVVAVGAGLTIASFYLE